MPSILDRISTALFGDPRIQRATLNAPLDLRDSAGAMVRGGTRASPIWPSYGMDGQARRAFAIATLSACIDAIARDVSAAPLRVNREVDGQPVAEDTHPARIVVRDPNPTMSESEFWYFVTAMAAVTGFCLVEKVRSGAGRPVELWPLISPWLKVKPRNQKPPTWEYRVPGNDPWMLDAEDVIVVAYRPDMWGGWTGRSPLASIRRELQIDDQMTDFLNLILENGGVGPIGLRVPPGPDGIVRQLPEGERDRIVETFSQKYGGSGNWTKPAFLGSVSVERIGFSLDEMLFSEVREMIDLHICSVMGVPAGMIGTGAGLARNTYSNAETDIRKYYDGTISPLWSRLGGAFTRGLVREFDTSGALSMGFDAAEIAALQEDEEPKWAHAQAALGAGLVLLDEARAEIGLPPLAGGAGQVLYVPFAASVTKPGDLLAEAEVQPVPPALAPFAGTAPPPDDEEDDDDDTGGSGAAGRSLAARNGHDPWSGDESRAYADLDTGTALWRDAYTVVARRDEPRGTDPAAAGEPRHLILSDRKRDALHVRSKQTISKITRRGTPLLRAFFRAQGARITDQATRAADPEATFTRLAADAVTNADVFNAHITARLGQEQRALAEIDWALEEAELGKVLARYYSVNGTEAFKEVGRLLGVEIDWSLANPNVRELMTQLAGRVVGISETTRLDVSKVVADSLAEGVSMPQLADRLTGLFEDTYKGRAATVARTESQVAFNRASAIGYAETGQVAYLELLDNPDHDTDPGSDGWTCAMRNGQVVPLDQVGRHIEAEHPNGTLAVSPVLVTPLGE